jgi:hypothetical protein
MPFGNYTIVRLRIHHYRINLFSKWYNTRMIQNHEGEAPKENPFRGKVRPIQGRDLASVKSILEAWVRWPPVTGSVIEEEVDQDLYTMRSSLWNETGKSFFVAEDVDGRIVGVMGLSSPAQSMKPFARTEDPIELITAYVSPKDRMVRGVGRALVIRLEKEAKIQGKTEIILNSGPRYEKTGWGFYDRLEGFERVGQARNMYGPGFHAQVWSKIL